MRTQGNWALAAVVAATVGLSGCVGTHSAASVGHATAPAASATAASAVARPGGARPGNGRPGAARLDGGAANARSGPAEGGSTGTVSTVSASGFTLSTPTGQPVTVHETATTTYQPGTGPAPAGGATTPGAIAVGVPVLALGTTSGATITATRVVVRPTNGGPATSTTAEVVPFRRGASPTSKQVGQVPPDYTEGSGTIVGGTAADRATEAALAAYPGGVVDRVVVLGSGAYEVHNIGVSWPHHVFVNQDLQVVGAD